MSKAGKILGIDPPLAIPRWEVTITAKVSTHPIPPLRSLVRRRKGADCCLVPEESAVIVPELKASGGLTLPLKAKASEATAASVTVGRRLAEDLHPVANPAYDPDDGSLFVNSLGLARRAFARYALSDRYQGELTEFSGVYQPNRHCLR